MSPGQTGPVEPGQDVAAVLAALITARRTRATDLAHQVDCTPSHLSNVLRRTGRPSPALATRLDTALNAGGQITAALAHTPLIHRPPRPTPRPGRAALTRRACAALAGLARPPLTLAVLAFEWGDAYLLSHAQNRWIALRRDARYFLTAPTLDDLDQAINADYRANPVARDFDPPSDAYPAAVPDPGDAALDADTLITLAELRRAFPGWTLTCNLDLHAWIATTPAGTVCQNSAVSLAIALALIERRARQLTPGASWILPAWPGPPADPSGPPRPGPGGVIVSALPRVPPKPPRKESP